MCDTDAKDAPPDADATQAATLFRLGEFEHRYVCQQIALADSKASVVFAGASFVLAFGTGFFGREMLTDPLAPPSLIALVGIAAVITAAVFAFLVLLPRENRPGTDPFYFRDVAARSDAAAYVADMAVLAQRQRDAGDAMLRGAHRLSIICSEKFRLVRLALLCLAGGVAILALRLAV